MGQATCISLKQRERGHLCLGPSHNFGAPPVLWSSVGGAGPAKLMRNTLSSSKLLEEGKTTNPQWHRIWHKHADKHMKQVILISFKVQEGFLEWDTHELNHFKF